MDTTTFTTSIMGAPVTGKGAPKSAADWDSLTREGACLDAAVQKHIAHNWLPAVRAIVCERIEAKTGVARPTDPAKTTDPAKPVLVTEQTYKNLVISQNALTEDEYQAICQEVTNENPLNESIAGTGSGRAVAQKYLKAAQETVEKYGKQIGKLVENLVKRTGVNITLVKGKPDELELARALKVHEEMLDREKQAELDKLAG